MKPSRPDQCPMCGSLNRIPLRKDGTRYNPFTDKGLWDKCQCGECGHIWPFRFVHITTPASVQEAIQAEVLP